MAAQIVDEEIIYIDSNGFIRVLDTTQAGEVLIDWVSDEGGFIDFATGDFNADGDYEIVGIKGSGADGKLVVYDPVVSSRNVSTVTETPNGVPWKKLAEIGIGFKPLIVGAGNLDTGIEGDEIIFAYETGFNFSEVRVIKGNAVTPDGTGWLQHIPSVGRGVEFNRTWDTVTVGEITGSGTDEVIFTDATIIENNTKSRLAAYRVDDDSLQRKAPFFSQQSSSNSWRGTAIGHVTKGGNQDVVAIRKTSDNGPANIIIYQYFANKDPKLSEDDADDLIFINPRPARVMLADITGQVDGTRDKEAFFLRSVNNNADAIRLTVVNRGSDRVNKDDIEQKLDADNGWQRGAGGDVDGDGKDELIIMRPDKIRIYNDPIRTMNDTFEAVVATNNRSIRTADLDKNGIASGLEFETTVTGLENGVASGSKVTARIQLTANQQVVPFTVQIPNQPDWIKNLSPTSGVTSSTINFEVDATDLLPSTRSINVVIQTSSQDVVNAPLTLNIPIEILPAAIEVVPDNVVFTAPLCASTTISLTKELDIQGTDGISYTAVLAPVPVFAAAQLSLDGPILGGRLDADGLLELRDGKGNRTEMQVPAQPEVTSSSVNVDWESAVPWIPARSADANIRDTLTLTVDASKLVTTTTGTATLINGRSIAEAMLILIADPRAGRAPDNVRAVPVTFFCAQSQIFLPITTRS
ncbi:hypothetical protein KFU94_22060 [Chloroflexi bacterium TSY]|nr:hypothetical protein [Chloroflexi bacterium TSY]